MICGASIGGKCSNSEREHIDEDVGVAGRRIHHLLLVPLLLAGRPAQMPEGALHLANQLV